MKIAHFADTHIRNLWYHDEYLEVFNSIDEWLKDNPVDIIIHAGDVVHNKNVLSPESVSLMAAFLKLLASHAPTYVVPGNHDGIVFNQDRDDSVSVVSKIINTNLPFPLITLKKTQMFSIKVDGWDIPLVLCPVSIFEPETDWSIFPERSTGDGIWIGIHHGTVGTVRTETNYIMEGEVPLEKFQIFDFLMLGHIHKEQKIDKAGKFRYPGSTIQQGYEEGVDKGFLVWEINSKEDFKVEKITISNPKPFQSFVVESVPEFKKNFEQKGVLPNARLKLTICDARASASDIADLEKYVRQHTVLTTFQLAKGAGLEASRVTSAIQTMSLGHLEVQNSLIRDYLNDTMCIRDPDVIDSVVTLNSDLFSQEDNDVFEVARDCDWKVKRIDWSNFFNYSVDNTIDFANIRPGSVIGVFGKNASGKSSLIDVLCYGIWGKVTKENSKNGDLIRNSEKNASVSLQFDQFGEHVEIFRALDRQKNGNTTSELLFKSGKEENANLKDNAEDRKNNTTKLIASRFGSFQDFCSTSFMAQDGGLLFITEGSAGRRDLLKKMLNLNVFDKRVKSVNEQLYYFRHKKKLENKEVVEKEVNALIEKIGGLETSYLSMRDEYRAVSDKEKDVAAWITDFDKKNYEILQLNSKKFRERAEEMLEGARSRYLTTKSQALDLLVSSGAPTTREKKSGSEFAGEMRKKEATLSNLGYEVKSAKSEIDKLAKFLEEVSQEKEPATPPCVDASMDMPYECDLLKNFSSQKEKREKKFTDAVKSLEKNNEKLQQLTKEALIVEGELKILVLKRTAADKFANKQAEFAKLSADYASKKALSAQLAKDYVALKREVGEKNSVEAKRAAFQSLFEEKASKDATMAQILRDKRICEADGKAVRDQLAGEKARLEIILEKEKELARDLAKEYSLELLQKAIGGNGGLTVGLLKRYIPVINEETNNVIREVFEDMEVRLEATDKDTLEVHFSRGGRPESGVGMASGSEKAAISLALRLALASVSSLPKSNIFILDEPFSSFDLSRIDDFEKILFLLKTKFDYVVLITHSDRVKDFADEIIYLSPDEAGVSSVNV